LAAEQGFAPAAADLGLDGLGPESRGERQVVADEANLAPAQADWGTMLLQGAGVERNVNEAVEWFRRAAEQA
jgi:TPR repeat protein